MWISTATVRTGAYDSCYCLPEGVDEIERSLLSVYPLGVYTFTANRTDGRPTQQYDLFTQPLRYQCLYFSRHICYCLILKKKVAEQRIMKSKPNTHSQEAPGKKHTVSILISLTESRNMASVTHHLLSLLSFGRVEKDGRGGGFGGIEEGEVVGNWGHRPERAKDSGTFENYAVVFASFHLLCRVFESFTYLTKRT